MWYLWSKISLWSSEKWNYFDFNQFENVIFPILKKQYLIPLFHTGPESNELTRIDKYLDSLLNCIQFVKILTD